MEMLASNLPKNSDASGCFTTKYILTIRDEMNLQVLDKRL